MVCLWNDPLKISLIVISFGNLLMIGYPRSEIKKKKKSVTFTRKLEI